MTQPRGRLARLPSGRVAEVVDRLDDAGADPRFVAVVLETGRRVRVRRAAVEWITTETHP